MYCAFGPHRLHTWCCHERSFFGTLGRTEMSTGSIPVHSPGASPKEQVPQSEYAEGSCLGIGTLGLQYTSPAPTTLYMPHRPGTTTGVSRNRIINMTHPGQPWLPAPLSSHLGWKQHGLRETSIAISVEANCCGHHVNKVARL